MSSYELKFVKMRLTLFLLLSIISFTGRTQYFRVDPWFYDSIAPDSYSFHVTGLANFNDSMVVTIKLTTGFPLHTVLYEGVQDFTDSTATTFNNFIYNPATEEFSVDLGIFPSLDMWLWIRSTINGVMREEILVTQFDPPQ